jgi:hypothetical protein
VSIPVTRADVGPDGLIASADIRQKIASVLWALAEYSRERG